jgi:hypothetical protein
MMTHAVAWAGVNTRQVAPRLAVNRLRIGDWRTGPKVELTGIADRSLTVSLKDPTELTFSLPGPHPDAKLLRELISDVTWSRNGVDLARCRLMESADDIDANRNTVHATCRDYRGLLDRRLIMPGDGLIISVDGTRTPASDQQITFTASMPIKDAIWEVIDNVQSQPGGDLGIRKGQWPNVLGDTVASGPTEPLASGFVVPLPWLQFPGDTTAWQAIQTLMKTNGGIDFDIDAGRLANLYIPQRGGVDKGVTLDYGGTVTALSRSVRADDYANAVREVGQEPSKPAYILASDLAKRPEGRWDLNFADPTLQNTGGPLDNQTAVNNMGRYNFQNTSRLAPSYRLTLAANAWRGPDWLWIGDVVTVIADTGRLNVRDQLRVTSLTLTVDQNGTETVQVDVGRQRSTVQKAWKQLTQQVTALNRR